MDHPEVEVVYLGGESSAGKPFGELYPHLAHAVNLPVEEVDAENIAERTEVVFLSLPNGLACEIAPKLLEKKCKVLDLSADYRFSELTTYTTWYGKQRTDSATAATAVYGLPELYRDRIADAQLIGCPGCYPTASLLALSPLLKQGLIVPKPPLLMLSLAPPAADGKRKSTYC
jgi:N-acetyl-gamma-glutamyl-phosphate reductase